jgi:hypothetical protein
MNPNNQPASGIQHFLRSRKTPAQYARERNSVMADAPQGRALKEKGKEAHAEYEELTKQSSAASNAYTRDKDAEQRQFDNDFPLTEQDPEKLEMGNSHRTHRAALLPKQHARLVQPAADKATATLRYVNTWCWGFAVERYRVLTFLFYKMANQRDRMLKENPYHYRNLHQVQAHEGLRDSAFNDANVARQQFDTHYDFAG